MLSGVDLVVPDGSLTAILGASGSGKTTLLRVIMGFIAQEQGTVTVGDTVVADAAGVSLPPERRSIGYVAQEGALYPHLTVADNVSFGLPRSERKARVRASEVLKLVGLDPRYGDRQPQELSGGEQRRVALARALAPRPPLVVLDEPFSGLDAALRAETRAAVLGALEAQGTTALLVTHDQAEALSMGREVGVLMEGRLIQTAAPAVLYRRPANLDVARFVGEAVVLPGRAAEGVVTCALGELRLIDKSIQGPVETMIRPEQIEVRRGAAGGALARVTERAFYGPDSVVQLRLQDVPEPISARVLGPDVPEPGDPVELTVLGDVIAYPAPPESDGARPTPPLLNVPVSQ
ncbi:MAG TPA: ABC transporter ATP-binding protein [Solirubrobacteraceae bacterium]|nr:ABC transporter ATP-binding protein [Solirubrobacteraceae bacterium]